MSILQIQPRFSELEHWEALAVQQGLYFELLELSAPNVMVSDDVIGTYSKSGLVRSLHGAFVDINPASGDTQLQALSRRRCEESCALAERLGASNVVFHCSCFPFLRGSYLSQWAERCAEFYRSLAARYSLTVLIENCMDVDPTPLKTLMELVGSPKVAVCLDVGHANYSRAPIERWFEELQGSIRHLHLSDNRGLFDDHLPLGSGSIDFRHVSSLCDQAGTVEHVTLEVGDLDGVRQSLAYLQKNHLFGQE
ncbi:MAG: sugar phosphate isomerase/epimerase [Clostridia bacterium]|nr:sugar phosphate isomerase/epimerase [Clostridia bacterium]